MSALSGFVRLLVLGLLIALPIGGIVWSVYSYVSHDNLPVCDDDLRRYCYRYISYGGVFGGVESVEVSCGVDFDYFVLSNRYVDRDDCRVVYERGYNDSVEVGV